MDQFFSGISNNRYRFAAQLGSLLLLNARKITVEIDIQPAQGQRRGRSNY
jgi:hypothetical protein